jgi:endoglucanase
MRLPSCVSCLVGILAGCFASVGAAQVSSPGIAFVRAQHLRHGINASIWFAQSPHDYSAQRTGSYMDAADFRLMAQMGFDHARLSIDPEPLLARPLADGLNQEFLGRLDTAVDGMIANGLAVMIDIHPEDNYKFRLREGREGVDRFVELWRHLAAHYAGRDPNLVFFEVMNEPEVQDPFRWQGILAKTVAAIREAAPQNTILAAGASWDSLQDLLALTPVADDNVIYTFHFYEPYEFTHQGAGWATGWWRYTHDVPYPATDEAALEATLSELPEGSDRLELERYFLNHWDARHIRLLLDQAAGWGKKHHVPVVCNEFGAFRDHSQPVARAAYIHDVRTGLEADGIGWTMWDYRGNFGVVTRQDGKSIPDPPIVEALGLKAVAAAQPMAVAPAR